MTIPGRIKSGLLLTKKLLGENSPSERKPTGSFKISTKISLAFTGIIILFFMVLIVNVLMINKVTTTKSLLISSYECLNTIKDMDKSISLEKNLQNSVLSVGKTNSSSAQFAQAANIFKSADEKIKKSIKLLSADEVNNLNSLDNLHKQYQDIFFNNTLSIGKDISNGVVKDIETDRKRIETLKVLEIFDNDSQKLLASLTESLNKKIETFNSDIANQFFYMFAYFIATIVIAVIITICFSMILSKSILTNIKLLGSTAKALGEGNLDINVKMAYKDEIGLLGNIFSETINKLRNLLKRISSSSQTISAASNQVLSHNNQSQKDMENITLLMDTISEKTNKQQEKIKEIYEDASNISTNISNLTESADLLLTYANQTNRIGTSNLRSLKETISQMTHVNQEIHDTSAFMQRLLDSSKSIEGIADIIKGIASQTNLLSLNASIEAARAGEQGRGFAVVADEIRKLATQVGASSSNILTIIKNLNDDVSTSCEKMHATTSESEKGISLIEKTGEAFGQINDSINQQLEKISMLSISISNLSTSFSNINGAMQEILDSSENITSSTKITSSTMQEQLALLQELSSAAEEFSHVSNELRELVSVFKF